MQLLHRELLKACFAYIPAHSQFIQAERTFWILVRGLIASI